MRLFIAVRFTPEIKELLKAAAVQLKQQSVSGNFTDPENLQPPRAPPPSPNQTSPARYYWRIRSYFSAQRLP